MMATNLFICPKLNICYNSKLGSPCMFNLSDYQNEMLNTKDKSWAIQHLQSNNTNNKALANYILKNTNCNNIRTKPNYMKTWYH